MTDRKGFSEDFPTKPTDQVLEQRFSGPPEIKKAFSTEVKQQAASLLEHVDKTLPPSEPVPPPVGLSEQSRQEWMKAGVKKLLRTHGEATIPQPPFTGIDFTPLIGRQTSPVLVTSLNSLYKFMHNEAYIDTMPSHQARTDWRNSILFHSEEDREVFQNDFENTNNFRINELMLATLAMSSLVRIAKNAGNETLRKEMVFLTDVLSYIRDGEDGEAYKRMTPEQKISVIRIYQQQIANVFHTLCPPASLTEKIGLL